MDGHHRSGAEVERDAESMEWAFWGPLGRVCPLFRLLLRAAPFLAAKLARTIESGWWWFPGMTTREEPRSYVAGTALAA